MRKADLEGTNNLEDRNGKEGTDELLSSQFAHYDMGVQSTTSLTHYRTRLVPARWDRWSAICYTLRSKSVKWIYKPPTIQPANSRYHLPASATPSKYQTLFHNIGQGQRRGFAAQKEQFAA